MNRGTSAGGQTALRRLFPLLAAAWLLLPAAASAGPATRFVSANIDVPVRRGAGDNYKITKMVKVSNRAELLEEKSGWAKVRFEDGDEGWLPQHLLTAVAPPVEDIKILRQQNEQLRGKNDDLSMELTALKEHQDSEGDKLADCIAEQNKIKAEHRAAEDTGKLFWFLAGGSVLLLGWLLGRFSHGPQRKKSGLSLR
ncbi:MAG: TIGR04211 family SH3 domain-containing protein [Candidatus Electronema sp. V4]|uniref:TIGR04211 family SH3 domain-containing protein n=1 Tax=Candidatus Electronema sp. V4 TaxID=3454756 RepID=UPI004055889C